MKEKEFASMTSRRRISNAISYLLLILISIIWLFPFFGLIMQSFRSYDSAVEYGGMVDYLVPKHFSMDNYKFLFDGGTNYVRWYINTLIISRTVTCDSAFLDDPISSLPFCISPISAVFPGLINEITMELK